MTSMSHRLPALSALLITLAAAPLAMAQYKVIGPDGKVTYTDRPPTSPQAQVQMLSPNGSVGSAGADLAALPAALRQPASRYPVTLYAGRNCAPCDVGRDLLVQRGIPFAEKRIDTNADLDAYVKFSGGRTLPLLTVGSQQIKSGSLSDWNSYLDAAGYPKTSALPASYRRPMPTPLAGNALPPGAIPASAPGPEPENQTPRAPAGNTPNIRF